MSCWQSSTNRRGAPIDRYARSSRSNARYARSGYFLHQFFPGLDRAGEVALSLTNVAEIEVGRHDGRVEIDHVLVGPGRGGDVAGIGLNRAHFVAQEAENLLVLFAPAGVDAGDLLPHAGGFAPLLLVFVELLQVDERVAVQPIETNHFLERLEGAIDEAAVTEVEPEAEQHVGVLERAQVGPLQERLMHVDRPADLALLPVQVAENHLDLERVGVRARGLRQLVDRLVDLVVDEEVEPEHVVGGLAEPATIDPAAVAQLVALPGLSHGEADEKRHAELQEAERTRSYPDQDLDEAGAPEVMKVHHALDEIRRIDDDDRSDLPLFEGVQRFGREHLR